MVQKNKQFSDAVWEVRKRAGKKRLGKKELAEAFKLMKAAPGNVERIKNLVKGI